MITATDYVAASFASIRINGSYSKATESNPTSVDAYRIATTDAGVITDEDRANAEKAIDMVRRETKFSEFNEKMVQACSRARLYRPDGILAYVAENYRRNVAKTVASQDNATGEYVGTVGGKLANVAVTVTGSRVIDTRFGQCRVINYSDVDGNCYVWLTDASPVGSVGDTLSISATIKNHTEFRGQKQTSLSRVRATLISKAA